MSRAKITVIEMFPIFFDCGGCGKKVRDAYDVPFYERFRPDLNFGDEIETIHGTDTVGGMPVCQDCYDTITAIPSQGA